ncbi:MAG TPA: ATP phosphoribosyltransferase regulatory subunit [Pyrinomonadaceae bacterium]|nr:ATP phosphoribosyltransferase regulatory subunit [Pyrinomonadaceae bacterium]
MTEHLSKIPDGMRYYTGAAASLRRAVEDCAMSVFDGWSFEEVIMPTVDYFALFARGMGAEARRAFRFTDSDGSLLALRPDITSSVARAAATLLADRPRPLRLSYAAPVYRQSQKSQAEWRRESTQLGCELIGARGDLADLEMLAIAAEVLQQLGLEGRYCITINNVEVFNGIAERLELDEAARARMRALIDVRDGAELQRFMDAYDTTAEERKVFSRLTRLSGKREILDLARGVITNPRSVAALAALEKVWLGIESLGLSKTFEIDLGDLAALDYYTGLVFKIYVDGLGARVGRGGRYDRLTENFGRAEPAIGFVLDLDGLTEVLVRSGRSRLDGRASDYSIIEGADAADVFREAARRRAGGERIRIELQSSDYD